MYRIFTILSAMFFSVCVFAQTINVRDLQGLKQDSIHKKILSNADYLVVYDYQCVPNPQTPTGKQKGLTFLQISI